MKNTRYERTAEVYWYRTPEEGRAIVNELANLYSDICEVRELCKTSSGYTIDFVRIGSGDNKLVVLSGMHGCEPGGPRGILTFLRRLLSKKGPKGEDLSEFLEETLKKQTIYFIPQLNVEGAIRFVKHFPDSWHPTWLGTTEDDWNRFFAEANEPFGYFTGSNLKQKNWFTDEQLNKWKDMGNDVGSSFTDEGVDLFYDWEQEKAPETRALKAFLKEISPDAVLDIHNHMGPTEIYAPGEFSKGAKADKEVEIAKAIQKEWIAEKLPINTGEVKTFNTGRETMFPSYFLNSIGATQVFVELDGGLREPGSGVGRNGTLSKGEELETVYVLLRTLIALGNSTTYRP